MDEVGVDLAIDRNEHIWLYEVNAGPQTKNHEWERAKNTIAYAHYIANKAATKELTGKLYLLARKLRTALDMLVDDLDKSKGAGLFTSFSNGFLRIKDQLKPRYAYLKESKLEELTESIVGLIEELDSSSSWSLSHWLSSFIMSIVYGSKHLKKQFTYPNQSLFSDDVWGINVNDGGDLFERELS